MRELAKSFNRARWLQKLWVCLPAHSARFVYVVDCHSALDLLSSPSIDTEAASQQLLAEASSPVRRQTAAPPASSVAAQRGANLLNAARALPTSLPAPAPRSGKLAKSGQLKPSKVTKGKLPRASLAGLVSESSQKKARGKQLYDLEPSPQKKGNSLPPQIATLEDEEEDEIVPEISQVQPDDDLPAEIPESLDVSAPTEAYGDEDIVDAPTSPIMAREYEQPPAAEQQRGRPGKSGQSVASPAVERNETEEVALLAPFESDKEASSASKKRHGRPRKSGESVASLAAEAQSSAEVNLSTTELLEANVSDAPRKSRGRPQSSDATVTSVAAEEKPITGKDLSTVEPHAGDSHDVAKKRSGRLRKSGDSVASRTSGASVDGADRVQQQATDETSAAPKKRPGRPRKSGESTTSRPSDVAFAEVDENFRESVLKGIQIEKPAVSVKPKRKVRPERDIDTHTNAEAGAGSRSAKKVKKLKGPKMISPDEPAFEEDVLPPIATPRQDLLRAALKDARQESREIRRQERRRAAEPRGDPHPRVEIPVGSTRSHSSRPQGEPASAPEPISAPAIVRKGAAAQRIAAQTRAGMASSSTEPAKRKKTNRHIHISFQDSGSVAEADGEDNEEAAHTSSKTSNGGQRDRAHNGAANTANAFNGVRRQSDNDEGDIVQDDQAQEEEDVDADNADDTDEQDDDQADTQRSRLPALNEVLDFADGEERLGVCAVGLAKKIDRACVNARVTLSRQDCSYDDIAECKDTIVHRLASIDSKIPEDTRFEFKRDAFAHLFRALSLVLEAMYDNFQQEQGEEGEVMVEVLESLEALQILHPFVRQILRFKDTMDSWKVKVTGHGQGDRLIKDVESHLVAPLRIVEKEFKKRLNLLQKAEEDRQDRIEMQRQRERQEQELIRQEEALRSARERRKRWQDLHIVRMQCELDPYRRRRLKYVEPPDTTETDANGNEFERVPFFGERSAPPPSSVLVTSGKDWTPEQDMALLDALQSFTRKFALMSPPSCDMLTTQIALEDIFRDHCGPRGALREFSVSDFAAKLVWVRSSWAQLLHLHPDWELPEWVKKIPVLP